MTRLFWIILAALAGGAALWYSFGERSSVPELAEVQVEDQGDQAVDLSAAGVELMHGDAGRLKWRLMAQSARFLQAGGVVEVDGPEIIYMLEGAEGELHVTAAKGLIEQDVERAKLWPDVEAVYQGNVIRAAELTYSGMENSLVLSGGVSLTGPTITCQAEELRFDMTTNVLTMGPGVHTTFLVELPVEEQGELTQ